MMPPAETPPPLTVRQTLGPWVAGWLLCVVLAFAVATVHIADEMVEAVFALGVTAIVTMVLVIGSDVRRTTRWEDEHGITAQREANLRKLEELMRRTGFERRTDESLDDAAKRLRRLAEAAGIRPI
jgi:hypothetical protein